MIEINQNQKDNKRNTIGLVYIIIKRILLTLIKLLQNKNYKEQRKICVEMW